MTIGDLIYKGYTGTVECDHENDCLFGSVQDIPDLVMYEGVNLAEIEDSFRAAVRDYLATCRLEGRAPAKAKPRVRRDPAHT